MLVQINELSEKRRGDTCYYYCSDTKLVFQVIGSKSQLDLLTRSILLFFPFFFKKKKPCHLFFKKILTKKMSNSMLTTNIFFMDAHAVPMSNWRW